jgi:hypothetical protein
MRKNFRGDKKSKIINTGVVPEWVTGQWHTLAMKRSAEALARGMQP